MDPIALFFAAIILAIIVYNVYLSVGFKSRSILNALFNGIFGAIFAFLAFYAHVESKSVPFTVAYSIVAFIFLALAIFVLSKPKKK